ncbi:hypothetical protein DPMN_115206 [Dreissena polymorpha]|uniref:Uncharacterized protein n=1 Tax=Dreissena polymorpha TaxID=45954 RepID=A0A9D4KLB1_DREPO|nr:hypothetical protein DPMN_115206 [Dreissena polymorpha]
MTTNICAKVQLAWFGHVTRHESLRKTVLQGALEGGRGHQKKSWMDNLRVDIPSHIVGHPRSIHYATLHSV